MQQLILIETVPMSIEYVEKKPIKLSSTNLAKLHIERAKDNSVSIKSDAVSIRMDSYNQSSGVPARPLTYTATSRYMGGGNLNLNVHMDEDGENFFNFKQMTADIGRMADAIPSVQPAVAEQHDGISMNFDFSKVFANILPTTDIEASFTPPDLELKVIERAKVIIKYVGGPIYIPRSADPNYEPLPEIFNIGAGKNIDMKV